MSEPLGWADIEGQLESALPSVRLIYTCSEAPTAIESISADT